MAKLKLGISNVKDNDTTFGSFAKGYRQSSNVIDRRASQYRPTETPAASSGHYGTYGKTSRDASTPAENTPDDYGGTGSAEFGPSLKAGQTRKVESQQAIDETFNRR